MSNYEHIGNKWKKLERSNKEIESHCKGKNSVKRKLNGNFELSNARTGIERAIGGPNSKMEETEERISKMEVKRIKIAQPK